MFYLLVAGCLLGELEEDRAENVIRFAEEVVELASREDLAFYRSGAQLHHGTGSAMSGRLADGITEMEDGLAGCEDLGTEAFSTWPQTLLADFISRAGRIDEATTILADIEIGLADGEEQVAALRLPLVRGRHCRRVGDDGGAETEFRRAIDVAAASDARGPQLRAAIELAELLDDRGDRDAARSVLKPIVDWFDDASDTADLRRARAILEHIGK